MLEVSRAGEDHGGTPFVADLDYLGVTLGAAGLDDGGDPGADEVLDAVWEREERIGRSDRAT